MIVGPNVVHTNQQYKIVICHIDDPTDKLNLTVLLEASFDGATVYNDTVRVQIGKYKAKSARFRIPNIPTSSRMELTIEDEDSYIHETMPLKVRRRLFSGLIQTDKPVYKPDDMVRFRVIVLDTELKPPAHVESVNVSIYDSEDNVVRCWDSAKLFTGVFESTFQVPSAAKHGIWNITVNIEDVQIASKRFEVKEYVLSSFDLQIVPSVMPLAKHGGLNLTITAKYPSQKPLKGKAEVELHSEYDEIYHKEEFEMFGVTQKWFPFNSALDMSEDQRIVQLKITFVESLTNSTISKETEITVYKYPYRVEIVKNRSHHLLEPKFKYALQFRYQDGSPAMGISGEVDVNQLGYKNTVTSDQEGLINLDLLLDFTGQVDIEPSLYETDRFGSGE
uniref:TEP1-F n=1 Tax=Anopheles dirus TaxID=7168 RepID=A0A182NV97_9DIPT